MRVYVWTYLVVKIGRVRAASIAKKVVISPDNVPKTKTKKVSRKSTTTAIETATEITDRETIDMINRGNTEMTGTETIGTIGDIVTKETIRGKGVIGGTDHAVIPTSTKGEAEATTRGLTQEAEAVIAATGASLAMIVTMKIEGESAGRIGAASTTEAAGATLHGPTLEVISIEWKYYGWSGLIGLMVDGDW